MLRITILLGFVFLFANLACGQDAEPAVPPVPVVPASPEKEFDPCDTMDGSLFKPINEIRVLLLQDDGLRLPPDCSSNHFTSESDGSQPRFASDMPYSWLPTDLFHRPVYFDDVPLERYGQTCNEHLQPVVSGVKFGLQLPMLPYKMGVDRPWDCISPLGHRPPGDCVPCIRQRLPWELDAALFQAGAVAGAAAALP